jgi:undecaprenyl diphosphate synthase
MDPSAKNINHIAIIMDGNSRWAHQNNLPSYSGHKQGVQTAKLAVQLALKYEIKNLSLFAFSTENWQRPAEEVDYILELFETHLNNEIENLIKNKVKLLIIGDLSKISQNLHNTINEINGNSLVDAKLNLYAAFSYGGKQEIVEAARKIIKSNIDPEQITVANFNKFLYAPEMPNIDLLIRTGNDKRISNFLLWHIAYAELYFLNKYWPDFNEEDFKSVMAEHNNRIRTFGKR